MKSWSQSATYLKLHSEILGYLIKTKLKDFLLVGNRPQNWAHPLKSGHFMSPKHRYVGRLSRGNGLKCWRCKALGTKGWMNQSVNKWVTEVFVEQPLASPGSANYWEGGPSKFNVNGSGKYWHIYLNFLLFCVLSSFLRFGKLFCFFCCCIFLLIVGERTLFFFFCFWFSINFC